MKQHRETKRRIIREQIIQKIKKKTVHNNEQPIPNLKAEVV